MGLRPADPTVSGGESIARGGAPPVIQLVYKFRQS
jgi:hypothetical protein